MFEVLHFNISLMSKLYSLLLSQDCTKYPVSEPVPLPRHQDSEEEEERRRKETEEREKQERVQASLREREKEVQRTLAEHLRDRDKVSHGSDRRSLGWCGSAVPSVA